MSKFEKALREFVETVNATGGLIINDAGENVPAGANDWPDLATAYLSACAALGEKPWNVEAEALAEEPEEEFFDDPNGAICPHCEERSNDPNHAANCGPEED